MLKIEYIWREILYQAVEKKNIYFTLTDLGKKFNLSTSVVSHALHPLRNLNIVKIEKTKSRVIDVERLLFFWATRRNIKSDLIYQTYNELSVAKREMSMPGGYIPTAYSAYKYFINRSLPADYENIYYYSDNLPDIKKRFPFNNKKSPNIFVLKKDPFFDCYKNITLGQLFVDLWNLPEWYSKEFQEVVLKIIKNNIGL